jgi:hypothetical protein
MLDEFARIEEMKLFDMDHDWLRPLWVRVLIVAVAGGWGIFEWVNDQHVWAMIFLAMAAYAFWSFFLSPGAGSGRNRDEGEGRDE